MFVLAIFGRRACMYMSKPCTTSLVVVIGSSDPLLSGCSAAAPHRFHRRASTFMGRCGVGAAYFVLATPLVVARASARSGQVFEL